MKEQRDKNVLQHGLIVYWRNCNSTHIILEKENDLVLVNKD